MDSTGVGFEWDEYRGLIAVYVHCARCGARIADGCEHVIVHAGYAARSYCQTCYDKLTAPLDSDSDVGE